MKTRSGVLALAVSIAFVQTGRAEWQAVEKIETYAVSGQSGVELYASIGARGPKIGGKGRTIAHTNFKLTWTRNYVPQGNACTLVSAVPKLTITYSVPKAGGKLPAALQDSWDIFAAGVLAHERVHGEQIKDMVRKIEATSVGLSVANDPRCSKIRTELQKRLALLSQEQRRQSRDFDRAELGEGGNVQRLVLDLVNSR